MDYLEYALLSIWLKHKLPLTLLLFAPRRRASRTAVLHLRFAIFDLLGDTKVAWLDVLCEFEVCKTILVSKVNILKCWRFSEDLRAAYKPCCRQFD